METNTGVVELPSALTVAAHRGPPAPTIRPAARKSRSTLQMVRAGLGRVRAEARHLLAVDKKIVLSTSIYADRAAPPAGPFCFELGGRRNVEEVGRLSGETRSELRYMYDRLERGDRFFIGRYGNEIAFNAWLMFGEMELGSGVTPTAPDVAYSYKVFSAPAFRRFGLARGYYAFVRPFLSRLGYRRLICHVRHDNLASLRLHQSVGFRNVGVIWDAHLGPIRRAVLIPEPHRPRLPAITRRSTGADWLSAETG
jgi:RimJ/RimL family protein N-acetyltransferase